MALQLLTTLQFAVAGPRTLGILQNPRTEVLPSRFILFTSGFSYFFFFVLIIVLCAQPLYLTFILSPYLT